MSPRRQDDTQTARQEKIHRAVSFVGNTRHEILLRFGSAVRSRRAQLGVTQADLAAKTGLSRSYLSAVECGRDGISLERAAQVAEALDTTLAELLS